jgi:hypothetical protein
VQQKTSLSFEKIQQLLALSGLISGIQSTGTVHNRPLQFAGIPQPIFHSDLLSKIPAIQRLSQNRLIQLLEITQGELPRQEIEKQRLLKNLFPKPL